VEQLEQLEFSEAEVQLADSVLLSFKRQAFSVDQLFNAYQNTAQLMSISVPEREPFFAFLMNRYSPRNGGYNGKAIHWAGYDPRTGAMVFNLINANK
jgi:hypothetical protein